MHLDSRPGFDDQSLEVDRQGGGQGGGLLAMLIEGDKHQGLAPGLLWHLEEGCV